VSRSEDARPGRATPTRYPTGAGSAEPVDGLTDGQLEALSWLEGLDPIPDRLPPG
jgi:hypothetical protein